KEVKEETVVDAIEFAHTEVKKICAAINGLRDKVGKPKRKVTPPEFDDAYYNGLKKKIGDRLTDALDTQKHPKATSYELVHPRRNPGPGHDHARHQRRHAAPRRIRGRGQTTLHAPLQLSAVFGW